MRRELQTRKKSLLRSVSDTPPPPTPYPGGGGNIHLYYIPLYGHISLQARSHKLPYKDISIFTELLELGSHKLPYKDISIFTELLGGGQARESQVGALLQRRAA